MKILLFMSIFILQIFGCETLYSQTKEKECNDISILKELSSEEITELTNNAKIVVDYYKDKNPKIKRLYCPPTEVHFTGNCSFPLDFHNVKYYLAMLFYDSNYKLKLKSNSDTLTYKKNPKMNIIRAENVKNIFIFYGINPDRIEIVDLKDTNPMDNNKTKIGREWNKYVRMEISNFNYYE